MDIPDSKVTRDRTYYFEDGDCTLQAGNRLFKVHRFLFQRSSVFFKTMFSLAQESGNTSAAAEGTSDENPINCQDTVEAFRALCWVLYATPKQICSAHDEGGSKPEELLLIAEITHKYEFTEFEDWALGLLEKSVSDEALMKVPVDRLEVLLFIASQCDRKALERKIQSAMVAMVLRSPSPFFSLAPIIKVAEGTKNRAFQAEVYYAFLQATRWKNNSNLSSLSRLDKSRVSLENIESDDDTFLKIVGLSEEQRLRVYCGFCSLTSLRNRLQKYPEIGTCQYSDCPRLWGDWWDTQIRDLRGVEFDDPGVFLNEMQKRLGTYNPPFYHANTKDASGVPCKQGRQDKLKEMKAALEKGLANRFMCP